MFGGWGLSVGGSVVLCGVAVTGTGNSEAWGLKCTSWACLKVAHTLPLKVPHKVAPSTLSISQFFWTSYTVCLGQWRSATYCHIFCRLRTNAWWLTFGFCCFDLPFNLCQMMYNPCVRSLGKCCQWLKNTGLVLFWIFSVVLTTADLINLITMGWTLSVNTGLLLSKLNGIG